MNYELLKARIWMWGPFILAGLLFLLTLYFVIPILTSTSGGEEPVETGYTRQSLAEVTASRVNLRRAYLAAHGGEELLAGLHSSRARGVLETSAGLVSFVSIKKRPGQSALMLRFPNHEQKFVVDGDVVWQRISAPQQKPVVNRLEGSEGQQVRHLGAFFDPVMALLLENEGTIHGIETAFSEDGTMIIVDFESEAFDLRSTAFINASTLRLASRVDALASGKERTFFYLDYQSANGVFVPFVVESYLDGEFENRVSIEQIEFNLGIFPATFQLPPELAN
ncbi:MAG: hypothetical protein EA353_11020 [Puniceicoccaceae bacterium]|nr:MAG: hypothetical protein EA353_11020 [Puniceicoccaceae bacterium]